MTKHTDIANTLVETTASRAGQSFKFFHISAQDHIFSLVNESGTFYELEVLTSAQRFVRSGDLVYDIGANIGNHSIWFAGVCGCQVRAFEPNDKAVSLLRLNVEENNLGERITIEPVGVGAAAGRAFVLRSDDTNLGATQLEASDDGDLRIVALDDLDNGSKVALIKIDVEGDEINVLQGAMGLLQRDHPVLIIEARSHTDYEAVFGLLNELGYQPAGSFGFTPTHIFCRPRGFASDPTIATLGYQQALESINRFNSDAQIAELKRWIGGVQTLVRGQQENQSKSQIAIDQERTQVRSMINTIEAKTSGLAEVAKSIDSLTRSFSDLQDKLDVRLTPQEVLAEVERRLMTSLRELAVAWSRQNEIAAARIAQLDAMVAKLQAESEVILALEHKVDAASAIAANCPTLIDEKSVRLESVITDFAASIDSRASAIVGRIERLEEIVSRQATTTRDSLIENQYLVGTLLERQLAQAARRISSRLTSEISETLSNVTQDQRKLSESLATALGSHVARIEQDLLATARQVHRASPTRATSPDIASGDEPWAVRRHKRSNGLLGPFAASSARLQGDFKPPGAADGPDVTSSDVSPTPRPAATPAMPLIRASSTSDVRAEFWAQPGLRLDDRGIVHCDISKPYSGLVSKSYDCLGGGLVKITIATRSIAEAGRNRVLRLVDDSDCQVGYDFPLVDGECDVTFFAPARTSAVKLYVLANITAPGPLFCIESLCVTLVDPEMHQVNVRRSIGLSTYAAMASIPSRVDMLKDCVASLLVQCDKVCVFLNNYPAVPAFLDHPRVEVRRSQDWDDRGDAGKMFWLEEHTGGSDKYLLIVDDDLIFPPNFAEVMSSKVAKNGNRAIYATHGVLLRQPIQNYYNKSSRAATFHFARELRDDRGVHIGATNALCMHSSLVKMKWCDFKYCNSADIWLGLYAQEHRIPILTPARPRNWIRENRHANPDETIYHHSVARTKTRFDSSLIQDAVLRAYGTVTIHPILKRKKFGIALQVSQDSLESFSVNAGRLSPDVEWVALLGFEGTDTGVAADTAIELETHMFDVRRDGLLASAADLGRRLGLDAVIALEGTTQLAVAAAPSASPQFSSTQVETSWLSRVDGPGTTSAIIVSQSVADAGALVEQLSGSGIEIQGGGQDEVADLEDAARRLGTTPPVPCRISETKTLNAVFDRVQVLNLDRRVDRWEAVSQQLQLAGIEAERFSAVDGSTDAVRQEYEAYASKPLVSVSPELPKLKGSFDFYFNYPSQAARTSHLEESAGEKAIRSAGAWGYLKSYDLILEAALKDGVRSLLVFDDDIQLHHQFAELFAKSMEELPEDWMIVQLGTMQYHWEPPWMDRYSPHLYKTNGSAIGSHAVGMRASVFPALLDHVRRFDMPFDIGALSAVVKSFADRCFIITPNLAIQRLNDSDINSSGFQKSRTLKEIAATHRWELPDYHA